ncbi:hypothetical protein C823_003572 [Eubacterium plexicaudatum ASF492]|nr:hypothetical protein C823_003572 [Eubacterium plexicaudatum ASF492]
MYETGTVISLLLLTVGMLNYINTMTGSIRSRKLTFSIMESVGMSEKQVKNYCCGKAFYTQAAPFLLH